MNYKLLAIATVASIFAILSYLYFDQAVAQYFASNSYGLKKYFSFITTFGKAEYYLVPSLLLFLLFRKKKEHISKASLYIFSTVALSGIFTDIIKIIVARYRPPALLHDNLYGFNWFDIGYIVNSFPSGHATTAFSAFVAFGLLFKRYFYLFLIPAFLIAVSRVVLDVHYLSDVTIGALVGSLWSYFLYYKFYKESR